jgi:hypothetical protein
MERANRLQEPDNPIDALVRLFVESRLSSRGTDVFDIEAAGKAIHERVTGIGECEIGLGVTCALADTLVDVVLDRERFWSLVGAIYGRLTRDPTHLAAVLASQSWRSDIEDATQRFFDSTIAHHAAASVATRDRDHVRAAFTLLQDIVEGPAKRYLATILAVARRSDYERLRKTDAGALVDQAAQLDIEGLTGGLDERLRHARAHEDFRIEADRVIICSRGAPIRELSVEEFADLVLKTVESTLALQVSVLCAAGSVGLRSLRRRRPS